MTETLAKTPLHDWHVAQGARMVDFAGWSMPVQYSSIVAEHQATRQAAGLFDISHMGRLRFDGPAAVQVLDRLLTRRVSRMQPGQIRYSLICNEQGGILDDVLIYRLSNPAGADFYLLVVNASNREKIVSWIQQQVAADEQLKWSDLTPHTAMIAVQGPQALALAQPFLGVSLEELPYYTGRVGSVGGPEGIISRTGYTGEDGCELILPATAARELWERMVLSGKQSGVLPAGLGARDTLRLEAGMPLYGHELSEQIDPYQAGLGFAVQLSDHDFIGRDALAPRQQDSGPYRRIGLRLDGKRVPRENYPVLQQQRKVGWITSGTFSPTLDRPIAMAYVEQEAAAEGNELAVDVRGRPEGARVVSLPFYRRNSSRN